MGLAAGSKFLQIDNLSSDYNKLLLQDKIAKNPTTHGSLFVPIILGSDKTTVSVATGNNEYYPLYMSIGNVHNNVRRAHRNALTLIGFLAIPKSEFYYSLSIQD
jgi:Plavaka transposase